MLKIGHNELVFLTSVLMEPEQVATYAPPEVPSVNFQLKSDVINTTLTSIEENFKSSMEGNTVTLSFPFLTGGNTMSGDYEVTTDSGIQIRVLFAASCVGRFMNVQLYGFRTRSFG